MDKRIFIHIVKITFKLNLNDDNYLCELAKS